MDNEGYYFFQKRWFSSLIWSVGLHALLILAAIFIHFQTGDERAPENLDFRLKRVQTVPTFSGKGTGGSGTPSPGAKTVQFSKPNTLSPMKMLSNIQSTSVSEEFRPEPPQQMPEHTLKPQPSSEKNLDSIILENQKEDASHKVEVKRESLSDFYQKDAEKSSKPIAPSGEGLVRSLSKSLNKIQLYSPANMDVDPDEGMPGFTPMAGLGGTGGSGGGEGIGHGRGIGNNSGNGGGLGPGEGVGEVGAGLGRFEPIDNFMDIQVYTYQDPQDGEKYFMIKVYAKPGSEALKVMPKEIIFTIDCSLSISKDRLEEFKRGIRYALTHLNRGDVFNIVAFKDKVIFFQKESVTATPEMVRQAELFVSGLTASQATDVYSAFNKIVRQPTARVPSNIILISDGRPTYGVVDSRELITSVSKLNGKVRPIFAFSGGAKVNRYLLDFVAYQNRAWSQFVQKTHLISETFSSFYDKIKDPVFLNLRYRLNNVDEKEVYPKSLPDFYRGAEFTLYGKYAEDNEFSMQLLGDIDGDTKELIFTRSFKDAQKGTEDIMRGYAFNKIYSLISRMTTEGQTPERLGQINDLSRRYGITTPYSADIAKSDS